MRRTLLICLPVALGIGTPVSAQQDGANVDTSQWQCKWCPGNEGKIEADVKGGLGYVTNDSYKFGDYTGLNEKSAYLLLDGDASGRNENGAYFDLQAKDLGLDSRHISIEGGKQGRAQIEASYDQLPKLNEDTSRTPYTGDSVQRLPSGWVPAQFTSGMTALPGTLREVNLSTERRKTTIGASFFQNPSLSYDVNYQYETKKGKRSAGLAFGAFRSSILAIPVDYESGILRAGVNYNAKRWQVAADYRISAFNNQNDYIRWENAFTIPGAVTEGQAAQDPDNTMQQWSASASLQATDAVSISGVLAYGQMRQDQKYLPYIINGSTANLPRESLDGKIDTLDASINVNAGIGEKINLQFQYSQHEQDNNTARASYDYVVADTATAATPRSNLPYSFRQRNIEVEGRYQLSRNHQFLLNYDTEIYDRTYQEVSQTAENTLQGRYKSRLADVLDLQVQMEYSNRDGEDYKAVQDITPAQNTLMRKYNLADRERNLIGMSLFYAPFNFLDFGLNTSLAMDDYTESEIGLQESEELFFSFDTRYMILNTITLTAAFAHANINSTQRGFATTIWKAENDDEVNMLDLGITYKTLVEKLSVGFNYTYMESTGKITIDDDSSFPSLTSDRQTFRLHGDYNLAKNSILNAAYIYEDYDESNWAKDDVSVNSIPNVVTLGEVSPSYSIGYFLVSYRHIF